MCLDGGDGFDTLIYSGSSSGVVVELDVINVESVVGSSFNDIIAGDASDALVADDDRIFGGDGDDILRGDRNQRSAQDDKSGGNDYLDGGAGDDRLGGKGGNDILLGGSGDDQLWGDDGDDILRGGIGDDRLVGDNASQGEGSDTFVLARGEGTDTIIDFEVGRDFIGLADGLTFEDLTFADNAIQAGSETLAILRGVNTATLAAGTFTIVA